MKESIRRQRDSARRAAASSWIVTVILAVLGAAAWFGGSLAGWFGASDAIELRGTTVQRGLLRMTTIVAGSLEAADSVSLTCELEGRTTILSLAPEGSRVKAGDIVCEIDASILNEDLLQQTIAVSNAAADQVKARQAQQIQESRNHSSVASAQQQLEFAELDLERFLQGDRVAELTRARQAIDLAREEETRTADRYAWSEKLSSRGFLTASELEADRISHHRAQVELEQASLALDLLERFELPRTEAELRAALEEALREKQRAELEAAATLIDFEAEVVASEARLALEQEKLERIETQIEKATIRAPRDGMLVYRQFDSDELPMEEGRSVRERQTLMYIPSAEGMIAEAKVHESMLERIRVGQTCTLSVDALRGQTFEGRVSFVALLPDQNSWWSNPNTRVYRTEVQILSSSEGLRPGMTCAIEILIDEIEDAVYVPVQAVFPAGDASVCYVERGGEVEARPVVVGPYDELWVQVLEGLREGETVLLTPPAERAPPQSDA